MAEIDFMSVLHKSTQRDYLARVNDPDFPKAKAAELANDSITTIGMATAAFATAAIAIWRVAGRR